MTIDHAGTFGDYLREHREARGYSAREVARRIDVAVTTITRIEDGSRLIPNPDLFLALVDVLELDLVTAVTLLAPYRRLWERLKTQGR